MLEEVHDEDERIVARDSVGIAYAGKIFSLHSKLFSLIRFLCT